MVTGLNATQAGLLMIPLMAALLIASGFRSSPLRACGAGRLALEQIRSARHFNGPGAVVFHGKWHVIFALDGTLVPLQQL